jgi:hypothetical protein
LTTVKKIFLHLLREPLVPFLVLGGGLFALVSWISPDEARDVRRIVVSPAQIEALAEQFSRTWMRSPTEAEMAGLVESHVRDEIYYREAVAIGLDQNDPVVRRRMRQKLEVILDDMATVSIPTDQVLAAFMRDNEERFRREARVSFVHVFLSLEKRQDLEGDAATLLAQLQAGASAEAVGDPTLLGYEFRWVMQRDVQKQFGAAFAEEVFALEPGVWTGPIFSALGGHLVMVTEREEGRMPQLAEVRSEVEREWLAVRSQELKDAAYKRLRDGYDVIFDQLPAGR